jgi:hypothetical protein
MPGTDQNLRLQAGQRELTAEQQAEAAHFVNGRIQEQLSTEPADESAAEAALAQAYHVAGLTPPATVFWLDGPLELVAAWTPPGILDQVKRRLNREMLQRVTLLAQKAKWNGASAFYRDASTLVWPEVRGQVLSTVWDSLVAQGMDTLKHAIGEHVNAPVRAAISSAVHPPIFLSVDDVTDKHTREDAWDTYGIEVVSRSRSGMVRESVYSYEDAPYRAFYAFFDAYYTPNALGAMDRFSQQVSGYWLGETLALLVRRPRLLLRDDAGQLHSASGKCVEYRDGWGVYAWHGVAVPKKVILKPEALTRQDFFRQRDLEVRRAIQERMGERFVATLGGVVIDPGTRGVLYEVELPGDPDRVARYIHVRDASSPREYHLRVPPTIATAAEAVAWSFGLTADEYAPTRES